MEHEWGRLSPTGAADLLEGLDAPWWIAGGWALELSGAPPREHKDVTSRSRAIVRMRWRATSRAGSWSSPEQAASLRGTESRSTRHADTLGS